MKNICLAILVALLFSSCYPNFALQSAKVLDKGKVSGGINAGVPSGASFGLRYGIGNHQELSLKSNFLVYNEIALKQSLIKDKSKPFQSAASIAVGNARIGIPTGEYKEVDNLMWDGTHKEEIFDDALVPLVALPFYASVHNAQDNLKLYGKLGPSFSFYNQHPELGLNSALGIAVGKKVSFALELYMHAPVSNNLDNMFNIPNTEILYLYNVGLVAGIVIGEF